MSYHMICIHHTSHAHVVRGAWDADNPYKVKSKRLAASEAWFGVRRALYCCCIWRCKMINSCPMPKHIFVLWPPQKLPNGTSDFYLGDHMTIAYLLFLFLFLFFRLLSFPVCSTISLKNDGYFEHVSYSSVFSKSPTYILDVKKFIVKMINTLFSDTKYSVLHRLI